MSSLRGHTCRMRIQPAPWGALSPPPPVTGRTQDRPVPKTQQGSTEEGQAGAGLRSQSAPGLDKWWASDGCAERVLDHRDWEVAGREGAQPLL